MTRFFIITRKIKVILIKEHKQRETQNLDDIGKKVLVNDTSPSQSIKTKIGIYRYQKTILFPITGLTNDSSPTLWHRIFLDHNIQQSTETILL